MLNQRTHMFQRVNVILFHVEKKKKKHNDKAKRSDFNNNQKTVLFSFKLIYRKRKHVRFSSQQFNTNQNIHFYFDYCLEQQNADIHSCVFSLFAISYVSNFNSVFTYRYLKIVKYKKKKNIS